MSDICFEDTDFKPGEKERRVGEMYRTGTAFHRTARCSVRIQHSCVDYTGSLGVSSAAPVRCHDTWGETLGKGTVHQRQKESAGVGDAVGMGMGMT